MKSRQRKKLVKQYDKLLEKQGILWWLHQQGLMLVVDYHRKGFKEYADRDYAEKAYVERAEKYEREDAALEAKLKKLKGKIGQKELDKFYAEQRRQAETDNFQVASKKEPQKASAGAAHE